MLRAVDDLDVIRRWSRAGSAFAESPAPQTPDLERLLLDTARVLHVTARLLVMPVTWLASYGQCVAHHRLAFLIEDELEDEYAHRLGYLLDCVREARREDRYVQAVEACRKRADRHAPEPGPLFQKQRLNARLTRLAFKESSETALRWHLWSRSFDLKDDALRSPQWVMRTNPSYQRRADLQGDLRCSIIETLRWDPQAGASAVEIQRRCACRSYPPVLAAIKALEQSGTIERVREGTSKRIQLIQAATAA